MSFVQAKEVESGMNYKQFIIEAFEREHGKWRARVRRVNGKPVKIVGRKTMAEFVTGIDANTAAAAMSAAMAAIDADSFSREKVSTEKFWRRSNT